MAKNNFNQRLRFFTRAKVNTTFVSAITKIAGQIIKILNW